MLTTMRLSYIYETSYISKDENGITSNVRHIDVFMPFIKHDNALFMRYDFNVEKLLETIYNGTELSNAIHYELLNLATSFTLKGAKKVAMLQGNSRDIMQECDLIEARNNAYTSVLTAIKEGQFVKLANDYMTLVNILNDSTITMTKEHYNDVIEHKQLIQDATIKALASLCYKMINAYTYQLKRDSRHLSVDAMMTDSDGVEVPIIETIAHEHIEVIQEKKRVQDILNAMTNKQLKAMHEALNEKQLTRYTKVIDTMLQSKPLTDRDKRFYQRSNNAIQEIYKTL